MLLDAGLSSPRRRRPPKHRVRRQRMPRAGMLIQLDGSYHRWLADHRPPFTLLLAVDDALFCEQEDSRKPTIEPPTWPTLPPPFPPSPGADSSPLEAGKRLRSSRLRTSVRRAIMRVIAQLLLAEIAPLVTTPETVYDHRG